jgi:hypothetical protein
MDEELTPTINLGEHPLFSGESPGLEYVYHYTRWERLLDIMATGFRLGPLARMNDPRESKDWMLDLLIQGTTLPDETAITAWKEIQDYRRKIRVAAFCLDQPYGNLDNQGRRGYARPRMWAQYADNHRGVCIVLNRVGLEQAIRRRYPERDGSWVRAGRVQYVETPQEDVMSSSVVLNSVDQARESVQEHFYRHAERLFFTKHVDWRDENEYRWVYYDADQSQTGEDGLKAPFVDIKAHVAAVVLGADYADAHLPIARMFAQIHNIGGVLVRCSWRGLYLHLETFADDGNRLIAYGQTSSRPPHVDMLMDKRLWSQQESGPVDA